MEFLDRAVVGILVGFALKAIFDLLSQRQRDRREDRLRFLDRRLQAYADFVTAVQLAASLRTRLQQTHGQREVLSSEAKAMLQRLDALDASEAAMMEREEMWKRVRDQQQTIAALAAEEARSKAEMLETSRDLSDAAALIGMLASRDVTRAANRLVDLLDSESESASPGQSVALVRDFMGATRQELGTRAPRKLFNGTRDIDV